MSVLQRSPLQDTHGAVYACQRAIAASAQRASLHALLAGIFGYLCLGNLPRLIPLAGFRDTVNLGEFVLFLLSLTTAILHPGLMRLFLIRWFPVYWIVLVSWCIGMLLHGFATGPFFYMVRLLLLLLSGFAGGYALKRRYGPDVEGVLRYFLVSFLVVAIIGIVMFYVFPELAVLWQLLVDRGIVFHGDPHRRRLVSTFFDPNYYSITAALYLIFTFVVWQSRRTAFWGLAFLLILVTILLTGSRTGIFTAVFALMGLAWENRDGMVSSLRRAAVPRKTVRLAAGAGIALAVGAPLYLPSVGHMLFRLAHASEEASALSRFDSLAMGQELFEEHPLTGFGYYYLLDRARELRGVNGLDCSIQNTLVSFGAILTLALALLFLSWLLSLRSAIRAWERTDGLLARSARLFVGYILLVTLFSSVFINALYYPLWLVPAVMLGSYFSLLARDTRLRRSPAPRARNASGEA